MKLTDVLGGGLKVLQPEGGCATCPRARKDFVPATLPDTDLILVGEAPGAQEVEEGEGFVGQSGQLLRNTLKQYGIEDYALTNTIHCRPPDNRNPHKKEIKACLNQYVIDEIKQYSTVVLIGKVPADTFFPDSSYAGLRGHVAWHADFPGTRFYTIYHPAYMLRRRDKMPEFEKQIVRLSRILEEDPFQPAWNLIRGDSPKSLDALDAMLARDTFAFDIETTGLESWHPDQEITAFAICASKKEAVFFHKNDPYFQKGLERVGEAVQDPTKTVLAHNAGFDLEWIERDLGITTQARIADTQALYYLIYMGEDFRKARMQSLKRLTNQELDGYRYLVSSPHLCNDVPLLAKYGSEDVIRTYQLFRKGFPKLNRTQVDLFFRISSPSSLALRRLQTNGLYIDTDHADILAESLTSKIEEEIKAWQEEDPEFDPEEHGSGDGFLRYVYEIRDFPVINRTEKDRKPASDKDTIKELIRDEGAKVLKHHLEVQTLEKQMSTFVKPYQSGKVLDPYTGRVHPSYLNCFTRTGRASSRQPNAQNIPRDKKVRSLFAAPEGKVFMQSDLSQIELRIAMCLSGDPVGIEAYLEEGDLHAKTAKKLAYDAGRDEWTKEDRTNAKIMNFALCVPMNSLCLTRDGWKSYWEVEVGDETLGFDGDRMVWTPITGKVHYRNQKLVNIANNDWSVTTTPDHRWYGDKRTDHGKRGRTMDPQFFTTEEFSSEHRIWLSRPLDERKERIAITEEEAAIIGWLYSDGRVKWNPIKFGTSSRGGKKRSVSGRIFQHENRFYPDIIKLLEPQHCIRDDRRRKDGTHIIILKPRYVRELLRRAGLEHGSLTDFVRKLTTKQLQAFLEAFKKADGLKEANYRVISQNEGDVADAVELAWFLSGYFPRRSVNGVYKGTKNYNIRGGHPTVGGQKVTQTDAGIGDVWCLTTEAGTWAMKQNDQIMITGNCYGGDAGTVKRYAYSTFGVEYSWNDAEKFHKTFFDTYAQLQPWHQEVIDNMRANRGYTETIMGHPRFLEGWDAPEKGKREHYERVAINTTCQSPAGYMTLLILYLVQQKIKERGLDKEGVLTTGSVHDSILYELPPNQVITMIKLVEEAVDEVYEWISDWFIVPLIMDYEIGESWGQLDEINKDVLLAA